MPRRFWKARSSSPSLFAAQMNAQATTAKVTTVTAVITISRKVLKAAASHQSVGRRLGAYRAADFSDSGHSGVEVCRRHRLRVAQGDGHHGHMSCEPTHDLDQRLVPLRKILKLIVQLFLVRRHEL